MASTKKPTFKDALAQVVVSNTQLLKTDAVLDALPADERSEVIAALLDPTINPRTIAKALNHMGHDITDHAIKNWRAHPSKRKDRSE